MNAKDMKIIAERQANLKIRLDRKTGELKENGLLLDDINIRYEMGERTRAIACGGIGAIHKLISRLGLPAAINEALSLLKIHLPYHESDHVLNMAYNILAGGRCLEDIELLRNNEVYLDALNTQRIPDPTTAGDFTRRFTSEEPIVALQEAINEKRRMLWKRQPKSFRDQAVIDVDATLSATDGECKRGIDLSYNGLWAYAVLLLSLANTREPLYLVNRPGNTPSQSDAVRWIDRAIDTVDGIFKKILVRGDTAYSLTKQFDRWDERIDFIFGYDAQPNVVKIADELPKSAWTPLRRPLRYKVKTRERERRENVKERIVREREYKNIRLRSEQVAEFHYRPTACKKTYRMIVVRKNLSVEKGEQRLIDEIRYFFYITNDWSSTAEEIVFSANQRCDQENLIEQLKNGIGALRMPTGDLHSNWAYMVIASLAWTFKAWFALQIREKKQRKSALRMEFKAFSQRYLQIPCQIIRTGRCVAYRVLSYHEHLSTFFETFSRIKTLKLA